VVILSAVIIISVFLKCCVNPVHVITELKKPKECGSYGALLMAASLTSSKASCISIEVSKCLVYTAASLQLLMVVWYLCWCYFVRSPPVPYWFPATVGVGMISIAGSKVGISRSFQLACFFLAALLCVVEWLWITARLYSSDRNAPAPSQFVHAAPVSLVALAFMAVFTKEISAPMPSRYYYHIAGHALFVWSTMAAFITMYFGWRRRGILRQFIRPASKRFVHQEWAALTFPLVATSTYALLYTGQIIVPYNSHRSVSGTAVTVWASMLAVLCVLVVFPIDVFYFCGLPLWLKEGLPAVPVLPPIDCLQEPVETRTEERKASFG